MTASTRDTIVDAARILFWSHGYRRTTIADICRAAEVNPGSVHYFFPAKLDILDAVLDRYLSGFRAELIDPIWREVADPIERIFALLDGYRSNLVASDFVLGCPIGKLALEMGDSEAGPLLAKIAANFDLWIGAVEECLEAAQLADGVDSKQVATLALTTMEGGVMLARAKRDLAPFDRSVAALRQHLENARRETQNAESL